mgnify:FL=1
MDLFYVAVILAFFGCTWGLVFLCGRLGGGA